MIYASLNGAEKTGPYKDLKEARSKLFYEGEKHDIMVLTDAEGVTLATWKKAWIRMDEWYAWHDKDKVDKMGGGV